MKATDVIARDHRAAEALFEEFKAATGDEKTHLENELFAALTVHELMEDTHFYPALNDETDGSEILKEIEDEQTKLKLEAMGTHALEFVTGTHEERIEKVMEKVVEHAKKEEELVFPLAEEVLGAERLEELGAAMEPDSAVAAKEKKDQNQ